MKRKSIITAIIVVIFVTMAFTSAECISPTTYTVCHSGCDFTKIQDAIDAASPNYTIEVRSGTYNESVIVNKRLHLLGLNINGGGKPVVNARGGGNAITLTADGITLENFTATNTEKDFSGICVRSNENIIINNDASNNKGYGIEIMSANNNTISGNIASNNRDGIHLGSEIHIHLGSEIQYGFSRNNLITRNIASNNREDGIGGNRCYNSTISGNYVDNNTGHGIYLCKSNDNSILGNFVNNNLKGICLYCDSNNNTVTTNTVTGNYASDDGSGIIFYDHSSNNNITCNNISNNNDYGIRLDYISNNNNIIGNNISNNDGGGIYLYRASNTNSITCNNISNNNNYGIHLYRASNNNNIIGNNISNNDGGGIHLYRASNNNITGNTASNNDDGICLTYSSNNIIYLNNFINNTRNDYSKMSPNTIRNIWNSTEKIKYTYKGEIHMNYVGNYWYGYDGRDVDGDGVSDTAYKNYIIDSYPLMMEFENYILASLF